jgi:hypothetical protein
MLRSWPGAAAQPLHRDTSAGSEAALFLFIPLEPMSAGEGGNGPPEVCAATLSRSIPRQVGQLSLANRSDPPTQLCGCTHHPKAAVPETECPGPKLAADEETAPMGSIVVYEPGLVHRGLSNRATEGTSRATPRLMLHLVIAPSQSRIRARPEGFLSASAQNHVRKWRALQLPLSAATCADYTSQGCSACLADALRMSTPLRTRCAWCAHSAQCVPDLAGMCPGGPRLHRGTSGLGGSTCLANDAPRRSDL